MVGSSENRSHTKKEANGVKALNYSMLAQKTDDIVAWKIIMVQQSMNLGCENVESISTEEKRQFFVVSRMTVGR